MDGRQEPSDHFRPSHFIVLDQEGFKKRFTGCTHNSCRDEGNGLSENGAFYQQATLGAISEHQTVSLGALVEDSAFSAERKIVSKTVSFPTKNAEFSIKVQSRKGVIGYTEFFELEAL